MLCLRGQQPYINAFDPIYSFRPARNFFIETYTFTSLESPLALLSWVFAPMMISSLYILGTIVRLLLISSSVASYPAPQVLNRSPPPWAADHGHNELYKPTPEHIIPMKVPLQFDAKHHSYEPHHNNEKNGTYKRSSCPALNTLANRGFIPRTGRNVKYENIAQSMRDVFNFGDDNVLSIIFLWSTRS